MGSKLKRILSPVLLTLFVTYVASLTLYTHSHIIGGVRILHSHPYSQSPDTGAHTHTAAQFNLLAQLSLYLALAAAALWIIAPFPISLGKPIPGRIEGICPNDRRRVWGRGPPATQSL